jgi:4-amino-4-deoxy-L-arabinose transferase-like glycosyltransferase
VITLEWRVPTMFRVKRTGWDEHAYVIFAQTLSAHGVTGIRQWLHDYPTNENLRKSPPMLRVGFLVPAMLTCQALGGFTADNLAWLSFVSGVALVLLGARFAENLAGRRMSIFCAILLVSSPLAAAISRRALQDGYAALLMLAALYFFDRCWRGRSIADLVLLGVSLCLALLTKEAAALLYLIMAVAAAYYFKAMRLRPSPGLLLPLIAAPLIYLGIEVAICGGIADFLRTYRTYASIQQTLGYTVQNEKGPWFRYLFDFFAIAPLVFMAGMVGFSNASAESFRHGRNLALIYFASAILSFSQMPVINVRLVLFADMFLRFAAALGIVYLAGRFNGGWSRRVLYGGLALLVVTDIFQFYQLFVLGDIYNPTTFLLLRAEGFYGLHPGD